MSYCELCQVHLKVSDGFKEWLQDSFPHFELHTNSKTHYRHGLPYVDVGQSTEPAGKSDNKAQWLKEDEYGNYCLWVRLNPRARGKHVHIDKFVHNPDDTCDHHAVILCECKPAEVPERVTEAKQILDKLGFDEGI